MNKINIKETLVMTGVPGTVLKSELVVFAEECTVSFTGITGNAHTVTYGDNNNTVTGITAACTDSLDGFLICVDSVNRKIYNSVQNSDPQ